jgi:hypothetical protein
MVQDVTDCTCRQQHSNAVSSGQVCSSAVTAVILANTLYRSSTSRNGLVPAAVAAGAARLAAAVATTAALAALVA